MSKGRSLIVATIPAYNEEKTIAGVILLTQKYVDKVIVCDDGSTDMTAKIAEKMGADVLRHERNAGYGAAIKSLLGKARELGADIMITLDGDGQHDPIDIPRLVKPVLEGSADIVVGSRFLKSVKGKKDVPLYRHVGIKAITKMTNAASNSRISDAQSGFRAYSRRALEKLRLHENGMGVSVEILMKAREQNLKVVEVPVACNYQGLQTSTHGPLTHGAGVIMSIVRLVVEEKPLIFLGLPGAVSLLVGVFFGIWMLQLYAIERRIVTNIALASMAFVLIGFFAIFTAITLYAITRLTWKTKNTD